MSVQTSNPPGAMQALVTDRGLISRMYNAVSKSAFGAGVLTTTVPVPPIAANELLVQVEYVALNPIDHKYVDLLSPKGSMLGCDFTGKVVRVGASAGNKWKVGDVVAGTVHGGLYPNTGAFAQYLKTDSDLVWRVPDHVKKEDAATFGVPAVTAMLALDAYLGIPVNSNPPLHNTEGKDRPSLFTYAGSSAVGLFAIQLAKRAGYRVVATASPRSFDLVKRYGADRVFDYRSETAVADIKAEFPDLKVALDAFSAFCASVIEKNGGKVVTLLDTGKSKTRGVTHEMIMVFTVFGDAFSWLPPLGPSFPAISSNREALVRFYGQLPKLDVSAPPVELIEGGIGAIVPGLAKLRDGDVSGKKLVVKM